MGSQQSGPLPVSAPDVRIVVLSAIKFYCQFCFAAVKIKNKTFNGMLPAKSKPTELFASETKP